MATLLKSRGSLVTPNETKEQIKQRRYYLNSLSRQRAKIKRQLGVDTVTLVEIFFDNPDMTREEFKEKYDSLVEKAKEDIKNVK